jgi:hypothetical protein
MAWWERRREDGADGHELSCIVLVLLLLLVLFAEVLWIALMTWFSILLRDAGSSRLSPLPMVFLLPM